MDFKGLAVFGICLGVYFIGLLIFVLVKRHLNKKKFNKEVQEIEKSEIDKDLDDEAKEKF